MVYFDIDSAFSVSCDSYQNNAEEKRWKVSDIFSKNKHTESIAKAIQVLHRP